MKLTHDKTATVRAHKCTPLFLVMYYTPIYSVYVLVGDANSIRDPYICAVHESVPTNRMLSSTGMLSLQ